MIKELEKELLNYNIELDINVDVANEMVEVELIQIYISLLINLII